MLTLSRPNNKPNFHPLELADGVSLRVQITPPAYESVVLSRITEDFGSAVLLRLECITDWLDVYTDSERAEGGREALPFSREALAELLRAWPGTLDKLLGLVEPHFRRVDGATEKNSGAPQSAAT